MNLNIIPEYKDFILSDDSRIILNGYRATGKTFAACQKIAYECLTNTKTCVYFCENPRMYVYGIFMDILFEYILYADKTSGFIKLTNGSIIHFFSKTSHFYKFTKQKVDTCVLDDTDDMFFEVYLQARRTSKQIVMISNSRVQFDELVESPTRIDVTWENPYFKL